MKWGSLVAFTVPAGLLLAAGLPLAYLDLPGEFWGAFRLVFPYVVLAAGLIVGWRFHRSRLLLAMLVLALAERAWLLSAGAPGASGAPGATDFLRLAVAALLPLDLAVVFLMRERGLLAGRSLARMALIGAQAGAGFFALRWPPRSLQAVLERPLVAGEWMPALPLPQVAAAAFAVSGAVMCLGWWRRRTRASAAYVWALAAVYLALTADRPGEAAPVLFGIAGLILIAGVLEDSYGWAFRDELTGLPARRALAEALGALHGDYSVAMIDIDHFKRFNDRYGHEAGDQVLRMVGGHLDRVGGGGHAFRYGGEEFTLLFPGKTVEESAPHLEALRQAIADTGFTPRRPDRPAGGSERRGRSARRAARALHVTVSAGLAERSERHATPAEVLKAADRALYRAKKAGRNRVANG